MNPWLWISGWGIPPRYVETLAQRYLPEKNHRCIPPARDWKSALEPTTHCIIGYSLGAFLLLREPSIFSRVETIKLLAPFLDFRKESGLGSRIATTQIKYLKRLLKKNPLAAVNDFYQRAGLDLTPLSTLPYSLEVLSWGIETLLTASANPPLATSCNLSAFIGTQDPLIQAARVPLPNITLIPQADHNLSALIQAP